MDETLTTAGEPQVIESANTYEGDIQTAGLAQTIDTQVQDDGSQVIETATPMDNNVTYQNVTEDTTPSFDTNKDFTQNLVQDALQTNYQNTVAQTDGQAITQFLDHDYDYNKSEAGTYWVAGAINDVDTQMSFLNTLVREEMYDELDLQKYYYDTTMATARAYASQKKKETAYGFYRAAQEKAIAEAQLTGWYMPAEGNYMLGQYTVAQNKLEDPDSTAEEKARAQRISGTVEKWFAANQIGTRGIKCLNMMNYEENVRHNTIMGELQKEANKIAAGQAAASAAAAKLQWRLYKFQLEEYELQSGHNITQQIGIDNKNLIGHDVSEYGGFTALEGHFGTKNTSALAEALSKSTGVYSSVLGSSNKAFVDSVLESNGKDPKEFYTKYKNDQTLASIKAYLNSENGASATSINLDSGAFEETKKSISGHKVYTITVDNKVIPGYFEEGVFTPLTEEDKTRMIQDGKTQIGTYLNNAYGENNIDWSGTNAITIDGTTYSLGRPDQSKNISSYSNLSSLGWKKAWNSNFGTHSSAGDAKGELAQMAKQSETTEGVEINGTKIKNLQHCPELMDEGGENEYTIFKGEDNEGNIKYYAVDDDGSFEERDKKDIKEVKTVKEVLKKGDTAEFENDIFGEDDNQERVVKASWVVGYNKEKNTTYFALPRSDGSVEYWSVEGDASSGHGQHTINGVNLSDKDIEKAGLRPLINTSEYMSPKELKYNSDQREVLTNDELTEKYSSAPGGGGGGSSSPMKSGYNVQDTVNNQKTNYTKTNVETLKWENNSPLHPYTETKEEKKSINDVLDTDTGTYYKKKGAK